MVSTSSTGDVCTVAYSRRGTNRDRLFLPLEPIERFRASRTWRLGRAIAEAGESMSQLEHPERTTQVAVGRLAPSPTGGLHLGHARTFLIAWLAARRSGGRVILRIEDLDASRARDDARAGAIVDLGWLGLDWDEGPYVQSERGAAYAAALERLKRD